MEKKYKKILQTSFDFIVRNLNNVDWICDHLFADEILTSGMIDAIKDIQPKPKGQIRELLFTLPYGGQKAYDSFMNALDGTYNTYVADYLREKTEWPNLEKRMQIVKKSEIVCCTEEQLTDIYKSRLGKVNHMTGKKKGKLLIMSNVQGPDQSTAASSENFPSYKTDFINQCRSRMDFDLTSLLQLFKGIKYETRGSDIKRHISGEDMREFLAEQLDKDDNATFDSLVVVIFSGGYRYTPGQIYDKDGIEVEREELFEMIRRSTAFKDKPKIVIIHTCNFEELEKTESNEDDFFVVSSQPSTKNGPWVIGEEMNGSYFIQALIHVFKNMAHEKSFMEMMEEVNKCLTSAMVPGKGQQSVAEVLILEHSDDKDLFFFPGLIDIPEVQLPVFGWPDVAELDCINRPNVSIAKETYETEQYRQMAIENINDWPDLTTRLKIVKKSDIKMCSKESFAKICESRQVYDMTGKKKGKCLSISNFQCIQQRTDETSTDTTQLTEKYNTMSEAAQCESVLDFDKTSILQLFKHMQYESKGADVIRDTSRDDMMQFLEQHLSKDDNAIFDSLVIVIFSGGYDYKPGHVYDKDGIEINTEVLFEMIRQSPAFKNKPKIVIISTYDLTEETHVFDELAAVQIPKINTDDLFVVTAKPKTKKGPWIIGDEMNGSYFIQAFVHVFKKMAHEKSFQEMMIEVGDCLQNAMVADHRKEAVAEIFILEQCEEKELFFFPGLSGVPANHMKVPGWPDLTNGVIPVQKKNVKKSELGFFLNRHKEKIYTMTSANRGKFILISNAHCIPDNQYEENKVTAERYSECIRNLDFDKSNMSQLLKYMGYDSKGGYQVKNSTKEEIKDFLKTKLIEIDNDSSFQYDSLVILFLSGKLLCDAGKIYDKNGDILPRREILDIIKECKYFKGKPKIIFVQSFSFTDWKWKMVGIS
ncbi:uncharacterized protein LOC143057634 isoform X3 [Mytilus galloprovincialis]|uniref:uncharacterized protein LOC143057634 isoform X3 n=1 Tax=Mytilus galloprovincialis TaxID=29158 RepID=UPI003F7C9CE0